MPRSGAFVTLLGGTNVQASAPEARDVLERGVADAITFPWGSIMLFGIDKVTKYHMDMPFCDRDFVWAMNKAKYDAHVRRRRRRSSTLTAPPNGRRRSPVRGPTSEHGGRDEDRGAWPDTRCTG